MPERAKGKPKVKRDNRRGSANARGYTYRWQQAARAYLARFPLCAECGRQGKTTVAEVVDHVRPHRGDARLFWDSTNWQGLCAPCHNRKTGRGA